VFLADITSAEPLRVQNFGTLIAMESYKGFERLDSVYRDAICLELSLDIF
jgi:hypothetical protein